MKERFIAMSNNYRRPVSSILKKTDGTLGSVANKPHQILAMFLVRTMFEKIIKGLYEKHNSKTFIKNFH